ncbi:glycosyltransferase family 2 protein [Ideonella livida]|uniref:Glycosyltransferase family 2 protein n=1 Tax=Ideonella livida TaxID=2707176 RepID=A0A7C9TLY3_9BURK|nr:glycosyltransferase family 2 protein [Ideonella livida]NDY92345.1 glycosyltransferase family 2 protein [Ideonella livida]
MNATVHPARQGLRRVALVMIVRDEALRIQAALASALPWVDDALVLDTGSQDDTVALARAAGARVEQTRWRNDFAAARNQALALAGADWHLVLDADELLVQGGEAVAALRQFEPTFVGSLRVDSRQGLGAQSSLAPSWISRVLPGHLRYSGRIHEQVRHQLPVRRLPVRLHHSGYSEAALAGKAGRNAALLRAALHESPQDAYLWYQLGKDHDVYARYREAVASFDHAEGLLREQPLQFPAWLHDLTVRRLHALKCVGEHERAILLAEAGLPVWKESPDFFFTLGDVMLDWAAREPRRAAQLLPMIENAWERCLALGERPDLEGAVLGRGSHLAAHNLAVLREQLPPGVGLSQLG